MTPRTFQIVTIPGGNSEVRVDGNPLACVRGYTLTDRVDEVPRLELDVRLVEDTQLSGEARVVVPDGTRETLVALGWTPPAEDGVA